MPDLDPASLPDREWFSPEELAEWLGIPERSVYQWNASNKAPRRVRVGKHIRYRRFDIEAWIRQRYVDEDLAA